MNGRTVHAIADSLGRSERITQTVLLGLETDGLAERTEDGGWRLTAEAERTFGPALFAAWPEWPPR